MSMSVKSMASVSSFGSGMSQASRRSARLAKKRAKKQDLELTSVEGESPKGSIYFDDENDEDPLLLTPVARRSSSRSASAIRSRVEKLKNSAKLKSKTIKKLDPIPEDKTHYEGVSASNFQPDSNQISYDYAEAPKDLTKSSKPAQAPEQKPLVLHIQSPQVTQDKEENAENSSEYRTTETRNIKKISGMVALGIFLGLVFYLVFWSVDSPTIQSTDIGENTLTPEQQHISEILGVDLHTVERLVETTFHTIISERFPGLNQETITFNEAQRQQINLLTEKIDALEQLIVSLSVD